ncbi:hypothetical protein ACOME3_003053 [Neoechinorhynchus agilis]
MNETIVFHKNQLSMSNLMSPPNKSKRYGSTHKAKKHNRHKGRNELTDENEILASLRSYNAAPPSHANETKTKKKRKPISMLSKPLRILMTTGLILFPPLAQKARRILVKGTMSGNSKDHKKALRRAKPYIFAANLLGLLIYLTVITIITGFVYIRRRRLMKEPAIGLEYNEDDWSVVPCANCDSQRVQKPCPAPVCEPHCTDQCVMYYQRQQQQVFYGFNKRSENCLSHCPKQCPQKCRPKCTVKCIAESCPKQCTKTCEFLCGAKLKYSMSRLATFV